MTLLRSFTLALLLLLLCVPLIQAQSSSIITDANITFTTIDVPGAVDTQVSAINSAGDMVGYYGQSDYGPATSFLYSNGTFTFFNYPGEPVTAALGINDAGVIVGYATQVPGEQYKLVGFLYDGTTFTTLQDGNDQATYAWGINNAGVVVGAAGSFSVTRGYVLLNGRYRIISFPGQYVYGIATSINNRKRIVGITDYDAFLYHNGTFLNIDFPGAQRTVAYGINDSGIVVGYYNPIATNDYYGFAWKNGQFISFKYTHSKATLAFSINGSGQIVGEYSFDLLTWHGFVTSPLTSASFPE